MPYTWYVKITVQMWRNIIFDPNRLLRRFYWKGYMWKWYPSIDVYVMIQIMGKKWSQTTYFSAYGKGAEAVKLMGSINSFHSGIYHRVPRKTECRVSTKQKQTSFQVIPILKWTIASATLYWPWSMCYNEDSFYLILYLKEASEQPKLTF